MADPVLRIPVDDEAFKRYMEAFERYQSQLQDQPEMWADTNEKVLEGVAANLSLADAIGASVAAAIRLGDVQQRNASRRKRESEDADVEEQRASGWRRKALDHVQELARSTSSVLRNVSGFAAGGSTGGMFGMVADAGKGLGGDIGALVSLAGHTLNANYEMNNAASDKLQFSRGIGATIGQQEGFHLGFGRYTNTDQGLDAVMNARGDPASWAAFQMLGVDRTKGSNADVYANTLRAQTNLAGRHLDKNGNIKFYETDPRGGSAFGTTHEDLNRLLAAQKQGPAAFEKALKDAASNKSPLADKQAEAATKSAIASDKLATRLADNVLALNSLANPTLDRVTTGLNQLADIAGKLYDLLSFNWFGAPSVGGAKGGASSNQSWLDKAANGLGHLIGLTDEQLGIAPAPGNAPSGARRPNSRSSLGAPSDEAINRLVSGGGGSTRSAALRDVEALAKRSGWRETSGFRTYAEQAKLYAKYQAYLHGGAFANVAAAPGMSAHEHGQAIDIGYGRDVSLAGIKAELRRLGLHVTRAFREHDHYHVEWAGAGSTASRDRGSTAAVGNVQVHVKVSAPPGHQTAVTANSAAKGG